VRRVAIVGSGLIGRAWAIVFARAGFAAALYDGIPGVATKARDILATDLAELAAQGLVQDPAGIAARVRVADSLEDALDGVEIVQENTPETVEHKQAIFAELDRLADPSTILASSTSGIVASRFTENLEGRHRCLIAHPVNPPHLVPVVELVGAPWTSPETVARAQAIYTDVRQVPIVVRREVDGFILNRLQAALVSEALRLVGEGYVSPQDLDKTVKDGLGLRWSFMGPLQTIELNAPGGIPDYCARYGPTLARISGASAETYSGDNLARVLAEWDALPDANAVAERMRWRDRRLGALRLHKQSQPEE
jgi:L-gulonate 3-dehydrogenase